MMRADECQVIGVLQKISDGRSLLRLRLLLRAQRIEADDNERIDPGEKFGVQKALRIGGSSVCDADRALGPTGDQLQEHPKILEQDITEEPGNSLIEFFRIGKILEARPEEAAHLEERREAIL